MTVDLELDDRIAKCRKILESDPNSQIFAALAEAYRKKGEFERAFQVCQNGLRIHPSYGSAHIVMAKINLDRGLYDWAETEVNKAQEVEGPNRSIELLLAEIHIYKGEYQQAIKLLKRLSQIDPDNSHIKKLLVIAERIPQEQKAEASQRTSRAVAPAPAGQPEPVAAPLGPSKLSAVELLREALLIPNMVGALFINTEGLVVESDWKSTMDQTLCGAALAEVNNFLNQELMKASFGSVDRVLIETGLSVFYQLVVPEGMFLFVGGAGVNLGALRMKVNGLMERYTPN